MINRYSQKSSPKKRNPKKETISFLLNYSKAFKIVKIKENSFQFYLN